MAFKMSSSFRESDNLNEKLTLRSVGEMRFRINTSTRPPGGAFRQRASQV
jgi:hypothetical protein